MTKKEFLLTIKKIGINGEGIGYYKKKVVFVQGALPGEEVIVKVTKEQEKFIDGELVRIVKMSDNRVEPFCKYYGKCGGCQLQHLQYENQLEMKREVIFDALEKYTNIEKIEIKDTIGMEEPNYYRNKAQLPVSFSGKNLVVGLYEINSNRIVFIDRCPIQDKLINKTINTALEFMDRLKVHAFNKKTNKGTVRYIVVRVGKKTKEVQLTVVLYKDDFKHKNIFSEKVMSAVPEVKSVYFNINKDLKTHEIFGNRFIHVNGKEEIFDKLGDLEFSLSPNAFYQLNPVQTEKLYNVILQALNPTGNEKVVDAYCGVGTIGQWIAKSVKEVRGMDVTRSAIRDAKVNAERNNINNTYYASGKAEKLIPKWIDKGWKPDVLIVDPPRVGLDNELLELLKRVTIPKIIYVSCNPSTLAKNLKELSKKYIIEFIQPVDMFPQTSHIESVTLLRRK